MAGHGRQYGRNLRSTMLSHSFACAARQAVAFAHLADEDDDPDSDEHLPFCGGEPRSAKGGRGAQRRRMTDEDAVEALRILRSELEVRKTWGGPGLREPWMYCVEAVYVCGVYRLYLVWGVPLVPWGSARGPFAGCACMEIPRLVGRSWCCSD